MLLPYECSARVGELRDDLECPHNAGHPLASVGLHHIRVRAEAAVEESREASDLVVEFCSHVGYRVEALFAQDARTFQHKCRGIPAERSHL